MYRGYIANTEASKKYLFLVVECFVLKIKERNLIKSNYVSMSNDIRFKKRRRKFKVF